MKRSEDERMGSRYKELHERLNLWYREHGRHDLPWRQTRDPYRIYLSEIMLQQTQVSTVLERFYFPFLERFPTLAVVAEASEEEVLKAWEGLGYYSRARHLHRTARLCNGVLPSTSQELERLPGIGRSTARAIACFAFDEAAPILDANVRRILYRFFRRRKATERELWRMAERLFDAKRPYDYNQAMMDLGAMICTPKDPRCDLCPLREGCRGRQAPERYPEAKKASKTPVRRAKILLCERGGAWALSQSRERFHGGLWHFPRFEDEVSGEFLGRELARYSHFALEAEIWRVAVLPKDYDKPIGFFTPKSIEELPLGGIDRKIFKKYFGVLSVES
ncbi:A/G-specific adenine glycosylase [Nitratifractor salsuginis]|uniref:Adenine DNA glycosylase n=1 Tax=Nitratifractor salsuginis (strain DSM 16511 / JCM 12458 / E9I37-1) TaxID=749222 RepID=E6X2I6_NITSE|nr:A/G-specific adenine glycosylase [Nitratifractor salsuginis]ADV47191.1 A/G-specific DNA-adenine glycosylase [Nitratifractor salsuginis DSM 16511]